ncbi:hypothetical protein [Baekduia soli]|nr:hypothetical protein [Baekduia soli]
MRALGFDALLVAARGPVTATDFCLRCEAVCWWDRRTTRTERIAA